MKKRVVLIIVALTVIAGIAISGSQADGTWQITGITPVGEGFVLVLWPHEVATATPTPTATALPTHTPTVTPSPTVTPTPTPGLFISGVCPGPVFLSIVPNDDGSSAVLLRCE